VVPVRLEIRELILILLPQSLIINRIGSSGILPAGMERDDADREIHDQHSASRRGAKSPTSNRLLSAFRSPRTPKTSMRTTSSSAMRSTSMKPDVG
jgi:hypothetical protein